LGCAEVKHINGDALDCRRSNLIPKLDNKSEFVREDGIIGHVLDSYGSQIAVIDSADIPRARLVRWWKDDSRGVLGKLSNGKQINLQRWILELESSDSRAVFFKDGDFTNCRRSNMHIVKNPTALRSYERKFNDFSIQGSTVYIKSYWKSYPFEVQVDVSDLDMIKSYGRWSIIGSAEPYLYAVGSNSSGKQIRMHRLIMNAQKTEIVDHIDGNTLNNQRANLRVTDNRGNALNRNVSSKGVSGDSNVYFLSHLKSRQWLVNLREKGRSLHWSRHEDLDTARETAQLARAMYYPTSKEGTAITVNLGGYLESSFVNGPGNRCVVWFAGCRRGCVGCFNPELWSFQPQNLVSPESLASRIINSQVHGLTISGGDPMDSPLATFRFLRALHDSNGELGDRLPGGIILFTGMVIEELNYVQRECLNYIDLLIDGRFEQDKRIDHILAGSSNQRFHFLDKPGRGKDRINPDEVKIDHEVEVHASSDHLEITGFPFVKHQWLKQHGLKVIK